VRKLMSFPFFPLQVDALHAKLEFHDFRGREVSFPPRSPCGLRRQPFPRRNRYRIEYRGQSVAYRPMSNWQWPDRSGVLELTKDAALRLPRHHLHRRELPRNVGWAFELAAAFDWRTRPGQITCLFHHDPRTRRRVMDKSGSRRKRQGRTIVATEACRSTCGAASPEIPGHFCRQFAEVSEPSHAPNRQRLIRSPRRRGRVALAAQHDRAPWRS
jgi:hypothetical protein